MAAILCVDDSEAIRKRVQALLAERGHSVQGAHRVMAGMRLMRRQTFDVILLDLDMPEIRGENAVRVMRQRMQVQTPIIIFSGQIQLSTIQELKPFGVTGFVTKSARFEDKLVQEVDSALAAAADGAAAPPVEAAAEPPPVDAAAFRPDNG